MIFFLMGRPLGSLRLSRWERKRPSACTASSAEAIAEADATGLPLGIFCTRNTLFFNLQAIINHRFK
jgi:hypothetical protein